MNIVDLFRGAQEKLPTYTVYRMADFDGPKEAILSTKNKSEAEALFATLRDLRREGIIGMFRTLS